MRGQRQRTTWSNSTCEWRRGIATAHALLCQWTGGEAARKRDTPQWCQLTLQYFHFEKVHLYCSFGISSVLVGQMHCTPWTQGPEIWTSKTRSEHMRSAVCVCVLVLVVRIRARKKACEGSCEHGSAVRFAHVLFIA